MEVSRQMETILQQHESSTFSKGKRKNVLGKEVQQNHKSRLYFWHYLREVLEATLALGIVSVIGLFFPSIWLQSHLIFCIFSLIVFVIATRYHVVTTYIVGFLAAGCYSLLLWHQTNPSFVLLQIFFEPFLLFASSIVISETLHTRRQQLEVVGQQHVQQKNFFQEMKKRYQTTQEHNAELERQLIGQAVSVSTVSEKMARLWELQGQERYNAIPDIVMHALHAKFCALYLLHNGRLSLCASQKRENSKFTNPVLLNLDEKDALISRTIESRQVCSIRDILTDSRSTQRAVAMMAGPLVDLRNQVVGVVIVDDIPLLKFLPTTVRLFGSLLQMISIAVHAEMPVTNIVRDVSHSLPSDTDVKAAQTALFASKREAFEANRVTQQLRRVHLLPTART